MDKTLIQEEVETCFCCRGEGYKLANNLVLYEFCPKCKGKGKVDWVTNIVASRSSRIDTSDLTLSNLYYKLKQHNIQELVRQIVTEYQEIGETVSVNIKNIHPSLYPHDFKSIHYQYQSNCLSLRKEF